MQADILKSIDILADMADASDNIEALATELDEIEKKSNKLKRELNFYNDILPEEKYYRATERLVDENLKASLETKIKKQEQALIDLNNELKDNLKIEDDLHDEQQNLESLIKETKEYIEVLKLRKTEKYQDLLKKQEEILKKQEESLIDNKKKYEEITNKIDILNLAKKEREEKLAKEKDKLKDTKACLINPASYIDYDMKKIDDARLVEIKDELLTLDKRRIEILTDPAMISQDAKNLILDDDRTSALAKIKELVTIAKTKPFMDIPNGTELTNILQEELVSASEKRDEFAAVIENKDYTGNINNVVTERVDFLNHKIDSLKEKINNLENEAQRLENEDLKEITEMKEKVANHHEELEQQIVVYEDILNSDDSDKSPKRKAILNTALIRKEDELKVVADILDSYQKDERNIVMKINKIFEDKINEINDEIVKIEKEVKELNKLNINTNKAKDVLAIETDKRKLKELDDKVKDIQHRQKYDQTPSEIFDEIEIYFGTLDPVDTKEVNNDDLLEIEDIEPVDFEIESINDKEKVDTELQEDNKLKEDNLELEKEDNDSLDDFTIEKFDLSNQYDLEDEPKEITEERKKVIKVESLDKNSNSDNNNDFIIGDYKDDDYLDMSSLFNDDNNGVL